MLTIIILFYMCALCLFFFYWGYIIGRYKIIENLQRMFMDENFIEKHYKQSLYWTMSSYITSLVLDKNIEIFKKREVSDETAK